MKGVDHHNLTQELVRSLLRFDNEKGELVWAYTKGKIRQGESATTSDRQIRIKGKRYHKDVVLDYYLRGTSRGAISPPKYLQEGELLHSYADMHEALEYDPSSGLLTWKIRVNNNIQIGQTIKEEKGDDYLHVRLYGKVYKAHRVAYLLMTGEWPTGIIDHEDHNKRNNKWVNITLTDKQGNSKNCKLGTNNTSGIIGVSYHKNKHKWQSNIGIDGKYITLYWGDSFEDACIKRREAEALYNFHPNHGKVET